MAVIGFLIYLFICIGIMFSPLLAISAIERGREPAWMEKSRTERRYQKKRAKLQAQLDALKEPTAPKPVDEVK